MKAYLLRIRPLRVSLLADPEHVQKSWGFYFFQSSIRKEVLP